MKEYTPEYLDEIRGIIGNKDVDAARVELSTMHPADIAELYQDLDLNEAEFLYRLLDDETAAEVVMELDEDDRKKLLSHLHPDEIADVIEQLDTDDATDVIQELDKEDREKVISEIDDVEQASNIIELMHYDEDTAGGVMKKEMIVVNENISMPECLKQMRQQAEKEDMDDIYNVYVVDDENRLTGIFPLSKMITNPSVSKIKKVMETEPFFVKVDTPVEDVVIAFEKYDLTTVPVVDPIGRLVGEITHDDIADERREQSEHDYQLASGISTDVESDDTIVAQTKARLPWLLIGMIGGIGTSIVLGQWESGLAANPAIALFIPLIAATGGNVGIQSSAIVVQGLANGSLDIRDSSRQLLKELGVGLINATIISLLVLLYNYFALGSSQSTVTWAVSLSLFAVIIFASIFGTFVPLMLKKLNIDPALATGPFITVTNDLIGMVIYMAIAWSLLSALGNTM